MARRGELILPAKPKPPSPYLLDPVDVWPATARALARHDWGVPSQRLRAALADALDGFDGFTRDAVLSGDPIDKFWLLLPRPRRLIAAGIDEPIALLVEKFCLGLILLAEKAQDRRFAWGSSRPSGRSTIAATLARNVAEGHLRHLLGPIGAMAIALAATFDPARWFATFRTIADAARISGGPDEATQGAFMALADIVSGERPGASQGAGVPSGPVIDQGD
jgi:hypothetical protein